jgi:Xaa-Pro aminopeptidase
MRLLTAWALAIGAGLLCASAAGQAPPPPPNQAGQGADDTSEGLFFTGPIIDRAIDRITEELGGHFKFDDDQVYNTRAVVKERFPRFFQENRARIIRVVNQWTEAMLGGDPPTPEEVAEWAKVAQPLIDGFGNLVEDSAKNMRPFMTDEQQTQMDGELAMFRVGLNYADRRLQVWSDGGYDWESEWPRSDKFHEKEQQRIKEYDLVRLRAQREALGLDPNSPAAAGGATSAPATRPDKSDDWTAYVESFIKRYKLDEAQKTAAYKLLHRAEDSRNNYLRRKLADIDAIEKRLKSAKTEEERTKIKAEYDHFNEPLDRYFQKLKEGLEALPTRKQRAEAAKTELENRAKAEPKAAGKHE